MIGNRLAVHDTTMSNFAIASGRSPSFIDLPCRRVASASARSSVRLATVIDFGRCAAKCVAVRSIISPAPTNNTWLSPSSPKILRATRTAAAAIETDCVPISVVERTSLATANVRWNKWFSIRPSPPALRASFSASFIWPRICGSPSTIESSPLATRNACRTAFTCGSTYECLCNSSRSSLRSAGDELT